MEGGFLKIPLYSRDVGKRKILIDNNKKDYPTLFPEIEFVFNPKPQRRPDKSRVADPDHDPNLREKNRTAKKKPGSGPIQFF